MIDWAPLLLTFKLAAISTLILFAIALPIAYWLAETKLKIKPFVETIISMPLVLPPTVLGFYFLVAFSPENAFGKWLDEIFNIRLVFSFHGLIVASIIYSLPFMVHPIQSGLADFPETLKLTAYSLGKSKWQTFIKVQIPNIKKQIITGSILSFAHVIGEFGVVLMIGGNIPGKTKVASIAIYEETEALNFSAANIYSLILFAMSFMILLSVFLLNKNIFNNRNNAAS
jgi:molybdate transport system permease protein